ncbi:hypothetical protein [Pseudooceanicola sp. MF1-13]|uniref:hypothetical protein n=1 Tax=Pseudooceanicola sp. MF1-13 TaxID=3379095 RepID=UPI003891D8D7
MVETTYEAQLRQIAAFDDLLEYFQGQKPRWDGDVAAAQAAYAALSGNLKGLISSELSREVHVDSTLDAPVGATYPTIKEAVDSLPRSSYAVVRLKAGQTHEISAHVNVGGMTIDFSYTGDLALGKPVIKHIAALEGGSNVMYGFIGHACSIQISTCIIQLPTESPDPNASWVTSGRSVFSGSRGRERFAGFQTCTVTGGVPEVTLGVISVYESGYAGLGFFVTTLDGPISAVVAASAGVFNIRKTAFTLANGATETDGGTLGTNYLSN